MAVRDTSIDVYAEINAAGVTGEQRTAIFEAIIARPGRTRRELVDITGIAVNAVAGRVNELVKAGAVVEGGPRPDEVTGVRAYPLFVPLHLAARWKRRER